jgi:hypothetical protein
MVPKGLPQVKRSKVKNVKIGGSSGLRTGCILEVDKQLEQATAIE